MWNDIPDDPIIACIERTGYPPWMQEDWSDDDLDDDYEYEDRRDFGLY